MCYNFLLFMKKKNSYQKKTSSLLLYHSKRKMRNKNSLQYICCFDIECFLDSNNIFIPYLFVSKLFICSQRSHNIVKGEYIDEYIGCISPSKEVEGDDRGCWKKDKMLDCSWYRVLSNSPFGLNRWIKMFIDDVSMFKDYIEHLLTIMSHLGIKVISCFAHNFSRFDGVFILPILPSLKEKYDIKINRDSDKIYKITIKKDKLQIHFMCSYNLFGMSLSKVGGIYAKGLEKLSLDHNNINKDNIQWLKSIRYCIRDVEILSNCMNRIVVQYQDMISRLNKEENIELNLEEFCTAGGLSLRTFLRFFNKKNNLYSISHKSPIYSYIKQSYFGGRCEVFKLKNTLGNIEHYDFPAMYSHVMLGSLPVGLGEWMDRFKVSEINISKDKIKELKKVFIKKVGFIRCEIFVPKHINIPPLPIRDEEDKKLYFKTGYISGVYYSEELLMALDIEGVELIKIYNILLYDKGYPLREYSSYNLKRYTKDNLLYKLLNNSLYGKLGSNMVDSDWEIISIKESYFKTILEYLPLDNKYALIRKRSFYKESSRYNVAIASAIASKGRVILYKSIQKILQNNPNTELMYCDTDSMFFDTSKSIVCNNMFKIEGKRNKYFSFKAQNIYKEGIFRGCKMYKVIDQNNKTTLRIKGVKASNVDIEQFNNISNKLLIRNNIQWVKQDKTKIRIENINKVYDPINNMKREIDEDLMKTRPIYHNKPKKSRISKILSTKSSFWWIENESSEDIDIIKEKISYDRKIYKDIKRSKFGKEDKYKYKINKKESNVIDIKIEIEKYSDKEILNNMYDHISKIIYFEKTCHMIGILYKNKNLTTISPCYMPSDQFILLHKDDFINNLIRRMNQFDDKYENIEIDKTEDIIVKREFIIRLLFY